MGKFHKIKPTVKKFCIRTSTDYVGQNVACLVYQIQSNLKPDDR